MTLIPTKKITLLFIASMLMPVLCAAAASELPTMPTEHITAQQVAAYALLTPKSTYQAPDETKKSVSATCLQAAQPATQEHMAELALLGAVRAGDLVRVQELLASGTIHNIDACVSLSRSPLQTLIDYKLINHSGMTSLMIAAALASTQEPCSCENVYYQIAQLLLDHGAHAFSIRAFGDKQLRTAADFATAPHVHTLMKRYRPIAL